MTRQFHRPARLDPEVAEAIEGGEDPAVASELAHRTAQALVGGFPEPDGAREIEPIIREGVVAVVAAHGVDAVAELWADSPATTLPGALWRLFLVREWLRRDPALIARRYAVVIDLTGAGPEASGAPCSQRAAAPARTAPRIPASTSPLPAVAIQPGPPSTLTRGRCGAAMRVVAPLSRTVAPVRRQISRTASPGWASTRSRLQRRVSRAGVP